MISINPHLPITWTQQERNGSLDNLWVEFQNTCERFEKQRQACDAGLAFVFTEGALVDAIRSGKW